MGLFLQYVNLYIKEWKCTLYAFTYIDLKIIWSMCQLDRNPTIKWIRKDIDSYTNFANYDLYAHLNFI